jgi:hypothetical protein
MSFKTYSRQDLADFTGRPLVSFPEGYITNSALPQALLLFKIGTCLADVAQLSPEKQQLVDFGILSMTDAIHLSAPYQTALASPFQSESIGSYSYSRVAQAVQQGLPTGVTWFDLAVGELTVCATFGSDIPMSMGIDVFGRNEGMPQGREGITTYLSPGDLAVSHQFGYDPAPGAAYQHPNPVPLGDAPYVPIDWVESPPGSGAYSPPGG